jgi:aspartate racemase
MRNLGLIGGMGPGATVFYYQKLARAGAGELLLIHADMEHVLTEVAAGNHIALAGYFARLIDRLARGGATVAAISAVTPHACIRELEKITPLPLVSIIDATAAGIRARGYSRVALFGTRFVVASRMFGMLDGIDVIVPEEIDAIHEAYMQVVGGGGTEGRQTLTRIAHSLPVDAVVLAGTDLSLVFDEANTDFPHVDCTRVHLGALLEAIR